MLDLDEDTLWQIASQMHYSGNDDSCKRLLRQILTLNPDSLGAKYNLAQILLQGDNADEAIPLFLDCIGNDFKVPESINRVVGWHIKKERFEDGLDFYNRHIREDIESENLMYLNSYLLFRLKHYGLCERIVRQILENNKERSDCYFTLALLAELKGDIPEAVDNVRIALFLNPCDKYKKACQRICALPSSGE